MSVFMGSVHQCAIFLFYAMPTRGIPSGAINNLTIIGRQITACRYVVDHCITVCNITGGRGATYASATRCVACGVIYDLFICGRQISAGRQMINLRITVSYITYS